MTTKCFLLLAGSLLVAGPLHAQFSLSGGDLYVYQAGSGTTATYQAGNGTIAAVNNSAAPVYIDQFSITANGLLNQVALPNATGDGSGFLASGDSATEGSLSLDSGGDTLAFGGYSGPALSSTSVNGVSAAANRDIGTVGANGTFSFAIQNGAQYQSTASTTGVLRGAVTDGAGNFWASGTGSTAGGGLGVYYYNAPAQSLTGSSTATRSVQIYGGNIYYTSGSGVSELAGGLATTGPQTSTVLTTGLSGTPYGFVFNSSMTSLYVANEAGGIQKWTFNGSAWSLAYTLDSGTDFDYVTGNFSGASPVLYATTIASSTGNEVVSITDTGAGSAATVLDTITGSSADAGNFDGIVFDPVAVPEPSVCPLIGLGLLLFLANRRQLRKA